MKLGKKTVCPFVRDIEYSDTWTSMDKTQYDKVHMFSLSILSTK